ncbi:MAG: hypothetical protein AAGB22_07145, partial [Bacteroidota bacterium]
VEQPAVPAAVPDTKADSVALPHVPPSDSNTFRYTLTHESTMVDLRKISEEAEKAGVYFSYSARVRKNRFRKLDIKMKFKDRNPEQQHRSEVRVRGHKFTTTFGWRTDSTGKVISFL